MENKDDSLFNVETLLGVVIAITSAALSSFGVNLQARSLKNERIILSLVESRDPAAELLLVDSAVRAQGTRVLQSNLSSIQDIQNDMEHIESNNSETDRVQFNISPKSQSMEDEESHISQESSIIATCDDPPPPPFLDSFLVYFYRKEVQEAQSLSITEAVSNFSIAHQNSNQWRTLVMARIWLRAQWWIGFILYLLCQLFGGVAALAFISPLLLAPLGSTGLVFNIIFARLFLGTGITSFDWIGTLMIVVGCSIVSLFGNKIPKPDQNIDEIMKLFTQPTFIAYSSTLIFASIFLSILIKSMEMKLLTLREDALRSSSVIDVHLSRTSGQRRANSWMKPATLSRGSVVSSTSANNAQKNHQENEISSSSPQLETADTPYPPPLETASPLSSFPTASNPIFPQCQRISLTNRYHHRHLVIETSSDLLISPSTYRYSNIEYQNSPKSSFLLNNRFFGSPFVNERNRQESLAEENQPLLQSTTQSTQPVSVRKGVLTSLVGIMYSVLGGLVASLTLLLTKSGVSILISAIFSGIQDPEKKLEGGQIAFLSVLLTLLILSVIAQIFSLNQALKYELPILVLPLFFSFYTVLSLFNTMVYVNAFGTAQVLDILVLFIGVGILVLGVSLLGKKPPTSTLDEGNLNQSTQ